MNIPISPSIPTIPYCPHQDECAERHSCEGRRCNPQQVPVEEEEKTT